MDRKITVLSEIVEFGMKCHINGGAFKLSLDPIHAKNQYLCRYFYVIAQQYVNMLLAMKTSLLLDHLVTQYIISR